MVWTTEIIRFIEQHKMGGHFSVSPYYKGNEKHRKEGLRFELTHNEQAEWVACASDVNYFAKTYCEVELTQKNKEIMEFQRFQLDRFDHLSGSLSAYAAAITHTLVFGCDYIVSYVGQARTSCVEWVGKVKNFYELLPFYMKPGIRAWNDSSLSFDNGTRFTTLALGSKDAAIGYTIDTLIFDTDCVSTKQTEDFYRTYFPMQSARRNSRTIIKGRAGTWIDKLAVNALPEAGVHRNNYHLHNFSAQPFQLENATVLHDIEKLIVEHNLNLGSVVELIKRLQGDA